MTYKDKKTCKLLTVIISLVIILTACTPKSTEQMIVEQDDFVLGTVGKIRIYADDEKAGNSAIEKAYARIVAIENTMSTSIEGSDVYNINKNAGNAAVEVKEETMSVIKKAIDYKELTNDVFNIAIGRLIELWGIGKDWQKVPNEEEIQDAKNHIDITQVELSGNNVMLKDPDMLIDLGGIAKGYAVDEAARVLRENGITSGFVNMGGDVYALGSKPDGTPWNVGIQDPEIGSGDVIAKVGLIDESIVTSGDYERYFIEDGVHYHHIIDPETGSPTRNELVSVTILSQKSVDGDVLSTAVFVMGLEEGLSFIEGLEDIEAVLITKDKKMYATSGAIDRVEVLNPEFQLQK